MQPKARHRLGAVKDRDYDAILFCFSESTSLQSCGTNAILQIVVYGTSNPIQLVGPTAEQHNRI